MAAGFTSADPADNAAPIDDARFARNYEEIIDILVDVNVQLSTSIQDKKLDLVFKTEREADHPLMPLRILRRIKGTVYKTNQLGECMASANTVSTVVNGWTQSELTTWISAMEIARLDVLQC